MLENETPGGLSQAPGPTACILNAAFVDIHMPREEEQRVISCAESGAEKADGVVQHQRPFGVLDGGLSCHCQELPP